MITASDEGFDQALLRQAFGCFPSGVTAFCGLIDGRPEGIAASSFTAWLRIRAPVAPKGWPSATLPPFGFIRSRGNVPKVFSTPAFSRTKFLSCNPLMWQSTWAENAS